MAKGYLIGEKNRRRLQTLLNGAGRSRNLGYVPTQPSIPNLYAYPYEITYAASLGTYLIWLPPECLIVNGEVRDAGANLEPVAADSGYPEGWYDLAKMLESDESPYDEWPEDGTFDVYMNLAGEAPTFHFDDGASEESERSKHRVLIANLISNNPKPNVKSAILIYTGNNKPFDLIQYFSESERAINYIVRNKFQIDGIFVELADKTLPPNEQDAPPPRTVRLCYTRPETPETLSEDPESCFDIDAVDTSHWEELSSYTRVWPLYDLSEKDEVIIDYRDAYYMLRDNISCDNKSVTLDGDEWYDKDDNDKDVALYHLWHFHDSENDYILSNITDGGTPPSWNWDAIRNLDFAIRERGTSLSVKNELHYLDAESVLKNILKGGDGSGGWAPKKDETMSALVCDEKSVSKGGDGWNLSGEQAVHMWHFHDSGANTPTAANSDFVLRTPGNGSDASHLEYISWSDLTSVLSTALGGGGGDIDPNKVISALAPKCDDQSITITADTSADISSVNIHMWHFHDHGADVQNPEMCDIVLRYYPDLSSSDSWLRYISLSAFEAKLSNDLGVDGGPISADQLSAVPSPGMFSWTPATRTMGAGGCMFGRQWVTATGTGAGKADGLYQLRCSIANTGYTTCAVVSDATLGQAPTTQYCWIPIYEISNGKIVNDYRGAFVVPCYE